MAKIVVLGANSFSGSHFVKHALDKGDDVVGVSRSPEPNLYFLPRLWSSSPGSYQFCQLDINNQSSEVSRVLKEIEPQIVVNFVAQGMVAESWREPWDWYYTNTVGLSKVLAALMELKNLKKYVHVTTPEVYGSTKSWIKESDIFLPSTPYATSRAAGDWHVMNLAKTYGLPAILTRAANVYGPGQQLYRVIPKAILSGLLGKPFPLHGDGLSTRSFIHILDVVDAMYKLTQSEFVGETFHISTRELVSILDLVDSIRNDLGKAYPINVSFMPERDGKDQTYQLDSSLLREKIGWSDTVSLRDGIYGVKKWILKYLPQLRDIPKEYIHKK